MSWVFFMCFALWFIRVPDSLGVGFDAFGVPPALCCVGLHCCSDGVLGGSCLPRPRSRDAETPPPSGAPAGRAGVGRGARGRRGMCVCVCVCMCMGEAGVEFDCVGVCVCVLL